jgi:hypothetical protein
MVRVTSHVKMDDIRPGQLWVLKERYVPPPVYSEPGMVPKFVVDEAGTPVLVIALNKSIVITLINDKIREWYYFDFIEAIDPRSENI